jgi:hypothetical protein
VTEMMITAGKQYSMSLFVSAIEKAKNKQSFMDLSLVFSSIKYTKLLNC